MKKGITKFLIYIYLFFFMFTLSAGEELQKVFILFRHGARKPIKQFLLFKKKPQRESVEDLTLTGIRQLYNLGVKMNRKYSKLIPNKLASKHVECFTSSKKRTLSSAYSFTLGFLKNINLKKIETPQKPKLFTPPNCSVDINNSNNLFALKIPFIPLKIQDRQHNFLFRAYDSCPNFNKDFQTYYKEGSKQFDKIFIKTFQIFEKNNYQIEKFYEQETEWNLYLADRFTDGYISKVFSDPTFKFNYEMLLHTLFLKSFTLKIEYMRKPIYNGINVNFFRDILANIDKLKKSKRKDWDNLKIFHLYSAHDINVIAFLNGIYQDNFISCGIRNYEKYVKNSSVKNYEDYKKIVAILKKENCHDLSDYGTNISIEIFSKNKKRNNLNEHQYLSELDLFVRIIYENNKNTILEFALNEFEDKIRKYAFVDFDLICGKPSILKKKANVSLVKVLKYCICIFAISLILLIFIYAIDDKKIKYDIVNSEIQLTE